MRLTMTLAAALASSSAFAAVQLDISSAFNYDAVGTSGEVAANIPTYGSYLNTAIGDHGVGQNGNRSYTNQGSVANGTALPDNGVVGAYQIGTVFDNGTDYRTKVDNSIGLVTTNTSPNPVSVTVTLPAAQQGFYESMNMLFVSGRDAAAASYRSWIVANYTDGTKTIILDTGLSGSTTNGSFGLNNWGVTTDASTFVNQAPGTGETVGVANVLTMNRILGQSGSLQSIRDGTASLWEFDSAIALDPTRELEGFTFNVQRSGVNRNQKLFVMAINAEVIPEPATAGLVTMAGAMILLRRRR